MNDYGTMKKLKTSNSIDIERTPTPSTMNSHSEV